jgi:hypothetical protein
MKLDFSTGIFDESLMDREFYYSFWQVVVGGNVNFWAKGQIPIN